MKLTKLDFGNPEPRKDFPGKLNNWEVHRGRHLRLVHSYPDFQSDLESALAALEDNNPISKPVCEKIREDIKKNILSYPTYSQLSKWCDWSQESSDTLAKNISRILFGFDMPRMLNQEGQIISDDIIDDFLSKFKEGGSNQQMKDELDQNIGQISTLNDVYSHEEISQKYNEFAQQGRVEFITFHPSYSYEEFIEGITVDIEEENKPSEKINYVLKPGIFKKLCKKALGAAIGLDSEETNSKSWKEIYEDYRNHTEVVDFDFALKFVLIIDEINRGDIAKIFGELITLMEADKRIGASNELIATLPASGDKFGVPRNLYIIATMNTADRSIALLDVALRRRFGFVEMAPDFNILISEHVEKNRDELEKNNVYQYLLDSIEAVSEKINKQIIDDLGRDKQIGHSFFFEVKNQEDLMMVWQYEILPLLEEYYYCDYDKILNAVGLKQDNKYLNKNVGIKGFKKMDELGDFLSGILNKKETSNV